MRSPLRAILTDATTSPVPPLAIPRRRHPVPTQTRLHTRQVPVTIYVAALLLIPTLMVAGFMSAGVWAGTGKSGTTQAVQAGTPSGQSATDREAPASPADVKGSMTIQQVVDALPPITATQILAKLGAPLDTPTSTQLKTLVEKGEGVDIPTLRTWLQEQGAK